jgi:hypothetical protein
MSDNPPSGDAAAGYVDGVKWIVGLAGAVFAGIFLHPEWLTQWPEKMRIYIAVVLFLFGISIMSGVVYLLWLNSVRRKKERLAEIEGTHSVPMVNPDPGKRKSPAEKRDSIKDELEKAQTPMNFWFAVLRGSFFLAASMGVFAFCFWVARPQKSTESGKKQATVPVPLRFTITQSALHKTKKGMEAHTFLLNQQTGQVWQMVCDGQGKVISFRRVPWLDSNGNPEKDEASASPAK